MQMVMAKVQLEELKKPNRRYALDLHTVRGMVQEADNMDKGLKAVLHRIQVYRMPPDDVPSAPQYPPQLLSMGIFPPSTELPNPDPQHRVESEPSLKGRQRPRLQYVTTISRVCLPPTSKKQHGAQITY
jgi:hypothetical protein